MADPAIAGARRTYLVEHYLVGAGAEELTRSATRLRDTVAQMEREGTEIGYVSATVVPADDYFASVLEAPTEHLTREALARAGIAFERISTAAPSTPPAGPARRGRPVLVAQSERSPHS